MSRARLCIDLVTETLDHRIQYATDGPRKLSISFFRLDELMFYNVTNEL